MLDFFKVAALRRHYVQPSDLLPQNEPPLIIVRGREPLLECKVLQLLEFSAPPPHTHTNTQTSFIFFHWKFPLRDMLTIVEMIKVDLEQLVYLH